MGSTGNTLVATKACSRRPSRARPTARSDLPPALIDGVLADPPALWLRGESPDVIAGDIALCHPPLAANEIRISVAPALVPGALRISVLAGDRPGLLAATAGTLAANGLSV